MKNDHGNQRSLKLPAPGVRGPAQKRRLHVLMALCSASALAWAWNTLPPALTRGPYLQSASATGITVVFRTSTAETSMLRYGTEQGAPWAFQMSGPSATTHVFAPTDLQPGTRYFYEISSGGAVLAGGPDRFFHTAPPTNSRAPLRFVAWGDSGNGSSAQLAVAERMVELVPPPQLALGLGDLVYDDGAASDYDPHLFRPYADLFPRTTFWPTIGNHDAHTQNAQPYLDAFYLPTQSGAQGRPSNTERYYSFDHGMAHFICADSETSSSEPGSAMYQWISDDLDSARARGKRWLFVFMHHPPYSRGSHDSDSESELIEIRQNLVPLFEAKGVDMVLVGHSHVYERSFLARGDRAIQSNPADYTKVGSPDGTIYLVSGCGGESDGGDLDHPLMSVSRGNVTGFSLIDLTWEELRGSFVERDGSTTDLFVVRKAADVLPPRVAHLQASSATEVEVVFDEPVRAGRGGSGAENLTHYALARGAVLGASLGSDLRTLSLTTTTLRPEHARTLLVQGVADVAGNVDPAGQAIGVVLTERGSTGGGTPVVPRGATWRYAKGTSALPSAWRTAGFNDSAWSQGPAGFGFDDGDDATEFTDMEDGYVSVYLRKSFTVLNPAAVTGLQLHVSYDDGFVAFLNGVEVARANVPAGQTNTTDASATHEAGTFEVFDLAAFRSTLLQGTNLLAVEGHNAGLSNGDFSIHPELRLSGGGSGSGAPPVAVLACAVQEANVPAQVFFSARRSSDPDGGELSYAWSFGDGTVGFGAVVQHTYVRVGTYTVSLLVRDGENLDAIDRHTLRIHALGTAPLARLSASSTRISAGSRIDFDSAGSLDPDGGPLHMCWDFGDPARGADNASTQLRPARVFPVAGKYPVSLTVTDDEGSSATQFVLIRVD